MKKEIDAFFFVPEGMKLDLSIDRPFKEYSEAADHATSLVEGGTIFHVKMTGVATVRRVAEIEKL